MIQSYHYYKSIAHRTNQKRAYLGKYLSPENVAPEFLNDDLILDLTQKLKEMQGEFKEVHKHVDQLRNTSARPGELRAEISRLDAEKQQLQAKIHKMKNNSHNDEGYFQDMLKVGSEQLGYK